MHKKLEAELVSLAHSILQMKNKDDINALHEKAHVIYEKLSVLRFVEDYINTTPQNEQSKEEIIEKIEENYVEETTNEQTAEIIEEPVNEQEESETLLTEEVQEEEQQPEVQEEAQEEQVFLEEKVAEPIEMDLPTQTEPEEEPALADEEHEREEPVEMEASTPSDTPVAQINDLFDGQISLEDELQKAYESDEAASLFEKATKEQPVIEESEPKAEQDQKRSLNDALFQNNIQVGLNDRIAFVKHLFNNSQEDFNRVLSQLNSFDTEKEAKTFINKFVRPDYDWTDKEEYEQRLIELIERKFV